MTSVSKLSHWARICLTAFSNRVNALSTAVKSRGRHLPARTRGTIRSMSGSALPKVSNSSPKRDT